MTQVEKKLVNDISLSLFFLIWRFEVIVIITYYIPIGDISYFLVFTNVCL